MKSQDIAETLSTVADLQKEWNELSLLARARAIHKIHQAGASFRSLAKALNCSESLLRHLNLAAQAPSLDQVLARQGRISIRELTRRAKAAAALRATKEREEHECERMKAGKSVCTAICDWLANDGLSGAYGEQIVGEARRLLADAEERGQLPLHPPAPAGTPIAVIY